MQHLLLLVIGTSWIVLGLGGLVVPDGMQELVKDLRPHRHGQALGMLPLGLGLVLWWSSQGIVLRWPILLIAVFAAAKGLWLWCGPKRLTDKATRWWMNAPVSVYRWWGLGVTMCGLVIVLCTVD